MNTQSYAQNERQRTRKSGHYSEMNKCQACRKALGVDYYSDPRSNGGPGHVLCRTCCIKGQRMDWDAAQRFYGSAA